MKPIFKLLNKFYKNKYRFGGVLLAIALILGVIGNMRLNASFWDSVVTTFSYLGLNKPEKVNFLTALSFILTAVVLFSGVVVLLLRKKADKFFAKVLMKNKNIILFGYGEINKTFLENFKKNKREENIIVLDKEEGKFDEYWEEGYVFLKKDIKDDNLLKDFDFEKTDNIIISLGNDRLNIDLSIRLIDALKNVSTETKLIVNCNDNDLNELFFEKLDNQSKINVKMFSFYTEIVADLFDKYSIEIVPYEYAKLNSDKKELKIAIVGNSNVNKELIKRIFSTFIFPNDVKTKIILIDENSNNFLDEIKFITNYSKDKFPHIELENIDLTCDLLKDKNFWTQKDLIDIIIAYEDESKNLGIAIDLFKNVYIFSKEEYPKVYFAMYEELELSKHIDKNNLLFKRYFTFGKMKEIFSVENLLDDKKFEIAKQIHSGYGVKFNENFLNLNKDDLNKKWFSSKYSDKLSNISQFEHIDFKLLSLGFYKKESNDKIEKLLEHNKKIFYNAIKKYTPFTLEEIKKFSIEIEKSYSKENNYKYNTKLVSDFWEKFIKSGDFYRLINTEHKRWMAFHYINGWEYNDKKDKLRKLHNCLIDIKDFKEDSKRMTIIYDIYSYFYIPNFLASAGYKIESLNLKKEKP